MPWAGHLIRSVQAAELSCRRESEITNPEVARPGAAIPTGDPLMSDVLFVGLAVAFFALAVAFAWFCEKVR